MKITLVSLDEATMTATIEYDRAGGQYLIELGFNRLLEDALRHEATLRTPKRRKPKGKRRAR